jgi:hypothetical protein
MSHTPFYKIHPQNRITMFNFLQKESDQGRLLSKINPNYSKAKSHGIRASEPLAVTWIRRPNSRAGLIHSPLSAGVIGLSSIRRYKTFTMIKPSLDPEEEQLSLSANWGDNITKVAPVSINDNDVIGNVLGIGNASFATHAKLFLPG